jgi:hypothetical protein
MSETIASSGEAIIEIKQGSEFIKIFCERTIAGHVTSSINNKQKAAEFFWQVFKQMLPSGLETLDFNENIISISNDAGKIIDVTAEGYVDYGPACSIHINVDFWEAVERFCPVHIGTARSPYTAF